LLPWIEAVSKATEGRVKFTIPPQNLAPPPEQMNMVRSGVADGAYMFAGFLLKSNPTVQLAFLPGTMKSGVADSVALWRTYVKHFKAKNPVKGVKLLGFFGVPPTHLFNLKKEPITSLAFYKGKKTWSLPGITAQAMAATGAVVVPGPAVRSYDILSKGVVDASCCLDFGDLNALKLTQFIGAVTKVDGGVFSAKFAMFLSEKKWAAISPKDRAIIDQLSGEALARRSAAIDKSDADALRAYIGNGGVVVDASPAFNAELKNIWDPLRKAWAAEAGKLGIDANAALDFYLEEAKKVAAEK
ncbi:MAG: TRAP transporter substrate-binding protein DctP, partial [Beijerinckiaceae bacterium]